MKNFTLTLVAVAVASLSMGQAIQDFNKTSTPGSPQGGNVNYILYDLLADNNMVLLDFMATWCGPCQASTPAINSIWEDYGAGANTSGSFYAFAMDVDNSESASQLDAFGTTYGGTYPAFIQCSSDYSFYDGLYGTGGIPLFILIKPNPADPAASTVALSQVGWANFVEDDIRDALFNNGFFANGIGATHQEQQFDVYPTAATTHFNVYMKETANVQVYNMAGQVVESHNNVTHTLTVNTANYEAGMYIVKVADRTFKVSVQK